MKLTWEDIEKRAVESVNDDSDFKNDFMEPSRDGDDPPQGQRIMKTELLENILANFLKEFSDMVADAMLRGIHPSPDVPFPATNAPQKLRTAPANKFTLAGGTVVQPMPLWMTEAIEIISRPDEFLGDAPEPNTKFSSSSKIMSNGFAKILAVSATAALIAAQISEEIVEKEKKTRMIVGCITAISSVVFLSAKDVKPLAITHALRTRQEKRTVRKFKSRA